MRNLWCIGILLAASGTAAAQDMNLTDVLLPGEAWHIAPMDCKTAAGLTGDGRGNVYVADGKQIWRIDKDGKASVFAKTEGAVHGLAVGPDGKIFAAEPDKKCVVLLGGDGKEQSRSEGEAVENLVVAKNGAIYATIDGDHGIYLFRNGKKRKVGELAPTPWSSPGALALWADSGTLVVGDAGDRYLYAFRIRQDGDLDARERYYPMLARRNRLNPLPPSADAMTNPSIQFWEESDNAGLALDAVGRAYATSREGVQMFDPTGRLSGIMVAPERAPLGGVAFGGAELDRLYVACGGKVYVRKTLAKGIAAKTGP
jgi:gluconolactonase